jgi:hypothetical protein
MALGAQGLIRLMATMAGVALHFPVMAPVRVAREFFRPLGNLGVGLVAGEALLVVELLLVPCPVASGAIDPIRFMSFRRRRFFRLRAECCGACRQERACAKQRCNPGGFTSHEHPPGRGICRFRAKTGKPHKIPIKQANNAGRARAGFFIPGMFPYSGNKNCNLWNVPIGFINKNGAEENR